MPATLHPATLAACPLLVVPRAPDNAVGSDRTDRQMVAV